MAGSGLITQVIDSIERSPTNRHESQAIGQQPAAQWRTGYGTNSAHLISEHAWARGSRQRICHEAPKVVEALGVEERRTSRSRQESETDIAGAEAGHSNFVRGR